VRILPPEAFSGIGARGACQKAEGGCCVPAIGLVWYGECERSLLGLDTIVLVVLLPIGRGMNMGPRCRRLLDQAVCVETL
jgi:hypothetical protein